VVGYDLTQLLVGSEGTLAIITRITLRLVPRPPARATLAAAFDGIQGAVDAVGALIERRVVPAAIELLDADSLRAATEFAGAQAAVAGLEANAASAGTMLIVECDGTPAAVDEEIVRVEDACRAVGAVRVSRARSDQERDALWAVRRQVSLALRATGLLKINHDVVVPRGRVPELFGTVDELRRRYHLRIAAFGHAGDGNIHVNLMVDRADAEQRARAREAERVLFERVVALEGSISGEHGIGFAKAPYLGIELSADVIELMRRLKRAFDPNQILNPGKIFPEAP
jgi:glycolate oxidase